VKFAECCDHEERLGPLQPPYGKEGRERIKGQTTCKNGACRKPQKGRCNSCSLPLGKRPLTNKRGKRKPERLLARTVTVGARGITQETVLEKKETMLLGFKKKKPPRVLKARGGKRSGGGLTPVDDSEKRWRRSTLKTGRNTTGQGHGKRGYRNQVER